uniref:Uncharacterized protein n=1 Tax=Rhizophora mucronata TaxID=61149 RepID=A0A2P2QFI6_RHIMU
MSSAAACSSVNFTYRECAPPSSALGHHDLSFV